MRQRWELQQLQFIFNPGRLGTNGIITEVISCPRLGAGVFLAGGGRGERDLKPGAAHPPHSPLTHQPGVNFVAHLLGSLYLCVLNLS